MSTKLRSACDKCHETKVRCSGGRPCQGCLTSRVSCFYSVSNPLGRPRGSRRRQNDETSKDGNAPDREEPNRIATATATATTNDEGLTELSRTHRGLIRSDDNHDDCSRTASTNLHGEGTSVPLDSGGSAVGDNSNLSLTNYGHDSLRMSNIATPNDFRLNSLTPAYNGNQCSGDMLPLVFDYNESDRFRMSDLTEFDFGSLINSDTQNSITGDNSICENDREGAAEFVSTNSENLNSLNTFRVMDTTVDESLQNLNSQTHSHSNHDSNLSISIPTDLNEVASDTVGSASTKKSPQITCTCLQKHAEVLSNPILAEVRAHDDPDDGFGSMEKALSLTKQATKAWQSLLTCSHCPYSDDQEVMLLTFISIRAVTRYLQNLSLPFNKSSRARLYRTAFNTPQHLVKIGSFDLEEDESMLVLKTLYQNTLQKVKCTLQSLQVIQYENKKRLLEETQNKIAGIGDYQASSNLFQVQQMSHGLITSLQALESSLNTK